MILMRKHAFYLIKIAFLVIFLLLTPAVMGEQIREVPIPNLRDVSIATYDRYGPVIYYNPYALRMLGPQISKFVRAHEYAHHVMNHMLREKMSKKDYGLTELRRSFELEADCFAAQLISREIAMAAAENLARFMGEKSSGREYPSGNERAAKIRECAGITS